MCLYGRRRRESSTARQGSGPPRPDPRADPLMRLQKLETGQSFKRRLMMLFAPLVLGMKVPDVLRVLWYREDFLGKPLNKLTQAVLRGDSEWTVGERELFAAWVSEQNKCRFCCEAHSAVATAALGSKVVRGAVVDEGRLSPKARAVLPFLEKLTVSPDRVEAADLVPMRAAGVSDPAIEDAIYICMLFCTFNRLT